MQHMKVGVISPEDLSVKMDLPSGSLVILDCRSGIEYSTWHICGALNIGGSRITRREILSGKVTIQSLLYEQLGHVCNKDVSIIVYDQCSVESNNLQSLAGRVADELAMCFTGVCFLRGGFIGFQSKFANLCWTNKHKMPDEDFVAPSQSVPSDEGHGGNVSGRQSSTAGNQAMTRSHTMITLCPTQSRTSLSQASDLRICGQLPSPVSQHPSIFIRESLSGPALPSGKQGPTTVLSYLLLGTQQDALTQASVLKHRITHIINVSTDGPMCPFVSPRNFLRIPVLDNFSDKITPYFNKAFIFLDNVKTTGGRALVHCSAGISRSPTLAIGYLMKSMHISVTEAYNIVKSSRASVSPNFNFLGQLTDYEMFLKSVVVDSAITAATTTQKSGSTRQKKRPSRLGFLSSLLRPLTATPSSPPSLTVPKLVTPLLPSPSAPFARLGINSPIEERAGVCLDNFPATSLDQLHFQPCQTGPRGTKTKRSATQAHTDSSQIRKRLSTVECCVADSRPKTTAACDKGGAADCCVPRGALSPRRHSSVLPLGSEMATEQPRGAVRRDSSQERSSCLASRSVSFERLGCAQECHHSTSSLSSANSHNSNLLV